jgi:hypothetical protein
MPDRNGIFSTFCYQKGTAKSAHYMLRFVYATTDQYVRTVKKYNTALPTANVIKIFCVK